MRPSTAKPGRMSADPPIQDYGRPHTRRPGAAAPGKRGPPFRSAARKAMLIGSGTDQIALRAEVDRICRKLRHVIAVIGSSTRFAWSIDIGSVCLPLLALLRSAECATFHPIANGMDLVARCPTSRITLLACKPSGPRPRRHRRDCGLLNWELSCSAGSSSAASATLVDLAQRGLIGTTVRWPGQNVCQRSNARCVPGDTQRHRAGRRSRYSVSGARCSKSPRPRRASRSARVRPLIRLPLPHSGPDAPGHAPRGPHRGHARQRRNGH